jgi:hypothetical protein
MIYLSYSDQSLFALYDGIMIRCVEIPGTWLLIQDIMNRAHAMSTLERQQAHYLPEHRGMCWALKIPFTRSCWDHLNARSVVVNRPEVLA